MTELQFIVVGGLLFLQLWVLAYIGGKVDRFYKDWKAQQ